MSAGEALTVGLFVCLSGDRNWVSRKIADRLLAFGTSKKHHGQPKRLGPKDLVQYCAVSQIEPTDRTSHTVSASPADISASGVSPSCDRLYTPPPDSILCAISDGPSIPLVGRPRPEPVPQFNNQ